MSCPCGSQRNFDLCCGPLLSGASRPLTAEALMRARYTAYTRKDIDYIARTFAPESRRNFEASSARTWAAEASWQGLQILSIEKGQAWDDEGAVEFVATYRQRGETIAHHERSRFRKTADDEWRFVEGVTTLRKTDAGGRDSLGPSAAATMAAKVGRNDPCPCGSGRKFKACCRA